MKFFVTCFLFVDYCIYSHIRHIIYNRILPEKFLITYHWVIKLRKFFQPPKYAISNIPCRRCFRDDEFDDSVYNDDGEDCAGLLYPVQVLKNHLRLIHGSMIMDHIRTRFLGGDLYVERLTCEYMW